MLPIEPKDPVDWGEVVYFWHIGDRRPRRRPGDAWWAELLAVMHGIVMTHVPTNGLAPLVLADSTAPWWLALSVPLGVYG